MVSWFLSLVLLLLIAIRAISTRLLDFLERLEYGVISTWILSGPVRYLPDAAARAIAHLVARDRQATVVGRWAPHRYDHLMVRYQQRRRRAGQFPAELFFTVLDDR